jgi:hypothetical protein
VRERCSCGDAPESIRQEEAMIGKKALSMLALTALAAAGCEDPIEAVDTTGCASLSGTFAATNFTAVSLTNATVSQNLLGNGGSFTLTFNNGNFTSIFIPTTGGQSMTNSGTVGINTDDGLITLGTTALFKGGADGSQTFSCLLSGNTLTLANLNTQFDFGQTGTTSPAQVRLTLVKS